MCLYPKLIKNKKYLPNKKNNWNPPKCEDYRLLYVTAACGKCLECRKQKTNPSSLINYLGFKGTRLNKEYAASAPIATSQNAIPYLAYWDIFKNYFANKQEENF